MFKPRPFGKYTLLDRLAVGGMAEIYLARLGVQERLIVIKRMLPNISEDKDFVDMFIDEAKISATLDHPNIVPVLDLGRISDDPFIAMEYVPGKDLQAVLNVLVERQTQLGPDHVAFVGQQMMRGLAYAHTKTSPTGEPLNLVHRDISPQNILISFEGEVKITDFGIAKAEDKLNKTQAGILKGKFSYMSPEQVMGEEIDARHDIFSAGIILYELLAGHRLFTGKVEWEILQKVRLGHIEPLTQYNPNVPKGLQKIVYRALTVDRDRRYPTSEEMEIDLVQYLGRNHPSYAESELAELMQNLFEKDMQAHRDRVRAAISELDPSPHAEQGAKLEATVPGTGPGAGDIKPLGSGPHSVEPDLERVISSKLGTNPKIEPPPAEQPVASNNLRDGRKKRSSRTSLWLWAAVAILAILAVSIGAVAALQPPWLLEWVGKTPVTATPVAVTPGEETPAVETPTPQTPEPQTSEVVSETGLPVTPTEDPEKTPDPETTATDNDVVTAHGVLLTVESDPVGELFVDGESMGETPVVLGELEAGHRYMLTVTRDGYRPGRKAWFSKKGETTLDFPLEKIEPQTKQTETAPAHEPGFLTVKVTNGVGRVFVDGALATATTPLIDYKLPPGDHSVRVENTTTGKSQTFTVTIRAGEPFEKRVRL